MKDGDWVKRSRDRIGRLLSAAGLHGWAGSWDAETDFGYRRRCEQAWKRAEEGALRHG